MPNGLGRSNSWAMSFKRSRLNCWGYLTALTRACMIITVHLRRYRYRVVSQNVRVRSELASGPGGHFRSGPEEIICVSLQPSLLRFS